MQKINTETSIEPVEVQILGRLLKVNCPSQEKAALNAAAEYLDRRLQELKMRTKVTNTEKLLFITALNICHELIQEKIKTKDHKLQMERRIDILKKNIEQALC